MLKIPKNEKAVTLIALIITIIVLLILAGIAFNSLLGSNGLLNRVSDAAEKSREASDNEEIALQKMENEIAKWENGGGGTITPPEDTDYGTNENVTPGVVKVNKPILKGMQPIRWEGASEQNTTESSSNWYAYISGNNSTDSKNSMWANAKTGDGSYWVWIPRYAYKITEKPAHADPQTGSGKIEVVFLKGTTNQYDDNGTMKDAVANGYTVHPAFTFGSIPLTGFWVGKYQSSSVEGNGNTSDLDNVTTKTIQSKPNVASWRYINVSTIFENCYTMGSKATYGWAGVSTGDTHMMKNIEWGAVAYLAHSQYGRNRNEISINNSSTYITGTGGVNASTTGNAYGIYDMSGCAYDYVAGNLTGYLESVGSQTNFDSIYNGAEKNKYFDIYAYSGTSGASGREPNYQANSSKIGDALYETSTAGTGSSSWFSDYSSFVLSDSPWFQRGRLLLCWRECRSILFRHRLWCC